MLKGQNFLNGARFSPGCAFVGQQPSERHARRTFHSDPSLLRVPETGPRR